MLDSLVHVQLNRPELGNRFDALAHAEFIAALAWLGSCGEASVLVLSAAGKVFSAGGDFDEIIAAGRSAEVRRRMARDAASVFMGWSMFPFRSSPPFRERPSASAPPWCRCATSAWPTAMRRSPIRTW